MLKCREAVALVLCSELGPYYEPAVVCVAPRGSQRRGAGAMTYGRPVVATAVGGLVDVTGVRVPPGDVTRLREVLGELLADAGWREHFGAAASETAREQVAREVAAGALARVYEEAVP